MNATLGNSELNKVGQISLGPLPHGEIRSLAIVIVGLFLMMHVLYASQGPVNILGGELVGNDGYTRLNRVQFIYEQETWNNSIYPRSNAPYGESIHWTKPLDLLLLLGGTALSMFVPFSTGLHLWGVIISPLLHIVAFSGLFCLMRHRLDRLGMILLAILFLLPPLLTSPFLVGRPDHHSLILAIFSWFLVGLHWGCENPQGWPNLMFVGCLGALGLWVSVEFLVPIGFFLAAYSIIWIWKGDAKIYPIVGIMGSLLSFSVCFLMLERIGENLFLIEYDRISLPHIFALMLIFMVWMGVGLLSRRATWLTSSLERMGVLGIGSLFAIGVQWSVFPGFFHGPLVGMDPAIRQLVWDHIAETQPLEVGDAIVNLGLGIMALPYLAYSLRQHSMPERQYQAVLVFVGAGIFISLALYEVRWTAYSSLLLLIPYVEYVRKVLAWTSERWSLWKGEIAALTIGLILVFWPLTIGTVIALEDQSSESLTNAKACPTMLLAKYFQNQYSRDQSVKTILAFKDFGPTLLYHSPHRVLGTPMHRNREGLRDSLDVMKAKNLSDAQAIIHRRQIDLVVVCQNSTVESAAYQDISSHNFYQRLLDGEIPPWLTEVGLPEKLQEAFRLFEVVKAMPFQESAISSQGHKRRPLRARSAYAELLIENSRKSS